MSSKKPIIDMQELFENGDGLIETDLIILGSGAAGLTAALSASIAGLKVLVLEHSQEIGGTTARSSGTVWIPDNLYLRAMNIAGDRELANSYLKSLVGARGDKSMWQAFLDNGPRMLKNLLDKADISFRPYSLAPDYRQELPGAAVGGRPLEPLPFDGRKLGAAFSHIASPLPELMLFGGMMVTRGEAAKLLQADRSIKAIWLGMQLVMRFLRDRLSYNRGTRLVLGNALIARLYKALLDRQIPVVRGIQTHRLIRKNDRISGVEISHAGEVFPVIANKGVVLAGGGFPASEEMREKHLPTPVPRYTPASPNCDGSTLKLALDAGAAFGPDGLDNASWFPSSIATRANGSTAVYPHIVLDRAKPGMIAVNGNGKRFTNEAVSYHEFVRTMYRTNAEERAIPAWLICDRTFIRKYGLGIIRPRTPSLRKFVANGYLFEARTVEQLAKAINAPPENLRMTINRFNGFAKSGKDEDFCKGENIYDQSNGDADVKPNPCIGPISNAPFYALPVYPTPLGTSRGLSADNHARVCDASGIPISGLYACGNDMQSVFGGEYPGAGAQIGQAMTFAWVAVQHAAQSNPETGQLSK